MSKKIPLIEVFGPTIQGEGAVIGQQTYFMRFGLCDYECKMCDSLHAVKPDLVKQNARWLTQEQIYVDFIKNVWNPTGTMNMTFSGGNPCIHDLSELVQLLKYGSVETDRMFVNPTQVSPFNITVETQGTFAPHWLNDVDLITVSPKGPGMGEDTNLETLDLFLFRTIDRRRNTVFKIVVFDQRDLEFAKMLYERYQYNGYPFYLSLGNPEPPGMERLAPAEHQAMLIGTYKQLFDDIKFDPILSRMRFLPQWHHLVWGNEKGK